MADIYEEVKAVIIETLDVKDPDEVKPETRFIEDLKADSMDQYLLIENLSDKFAVTIPDEAAQTIKCVQDAVNFIATVKK